MVGIGNQRLSDRLGSGITTSSTATAQLAAHTSAISTINTNLGTWSGGTAISRIAALETNQGTWSGGTAISRIGALETTVNATGTTAAGNAALSTRIGSGITTAAPADTRLAAVETRTTDTSGTVGIGNQRLSDRLGASITTASTAAAQLGTLTSGLATVNTNLGTWSGGTAISRITALEAVSVVNSAATVRNNLVTTAIPATTTTDIPFPTSVDSNSSITYSAPEFTVATAGYYLVEASVRIASAANVEIRIQCNLSGSGYRTKCSSIAPIAATVARGVRMAVGDKVKITAYCVSAVNLETGAEETNHISITRLGG